MTIDEFVTCSVCFYKIKSESQTKVLDCSAQHRFHQKCIWKWIVRNNTCPLCRETVSKYPPLGSAYNEYQHFIHALSPSPREKVK